MEFPLGITVFDELIKGGFLPGHKISILGTPGTGKSLLASIFIYNGITKYNQNGVYIATQEKKDEFYRYMNTFKMDFKKLEDEGKFRFIEQGLVKSEFNDLKKIFEIIKSINAKRVVYDSLNFFDIKYPDFGERNIEVLNYMRLLSGGGRVSLWITENYEEGVIKYRPAHFLSDGIIFLQHLPASEGPYNRALTVLKLRGVNHDDRKHPLEINYDGIKLKKL